MPKPEALRRLLYLLIVIACAFRAWDIVLHNPMDHIFSDPGRHWAHGRNALESAPMALFDPPLFQMWISLVQKWSLGVPRLVAAYAIAMSVITPWLWYRFFRELLSSRELALLGWAVLACLPSWLSIFSYFMSETLWLPLLGASLWQTLRARRKQTLGAFAGMVILWSMTVLTRSVAAPFAAIAGAWVWWHVPRKVRSALLGLAIATVAVVPFAVRNHANVGLWSPFGNGWLNSIYAISGKEKINITLQRKGGNFGYEFKSPSLIGMQFYPVSYWTTARSGGIEININMLNGAEDWKREYARAAAEGPGHWPLRWENFLFAMAGESWPDNNRDYIAGRASLAVRWVWVPLFAVLMGYGVWRHRDVIKTPLIPALILAWVLFQGVSLFAVNEGRYRKPLEGFLIAQALLFADLRRRQLSSRETL